MWPGKHFLQEILYGAIDRWIGKSVAKYASSLQEKVKFQLLKDF